jgi:hypothetical protein
MIWKFLHVLGAMLLIGNVVTTGLWSHWAMARRDQAVAVFATGAILAADAWLTVGGGTLLVAGAIRMVGDRALPWWDLPWTRAGAIALVASSAAWAVVLLPCQVVLRRQAATGDTDALWKTFKLWSVVGWASTAALVAGLWAMVMR